MLMVDIIYIAGIFILSLAIVLLAVRMLPEEPNNNIKHLKRARRTAFHSLKKIRKAG